MYMLQDHQSDVQLLPLPLFENVDLLMDLLCVSEADITFKAYYYTYTHCILVNLQQDYYTYSLNA
jgi:hypothetical protein